MPWAIPSEAEMEASLPRPRSKPPCKYGPRDENGYCPKKPPSGSGARTASMSSGRSRAACKYGPRGPDGLCPKKPKTQAQVTRQIKGVTKVAETYIPEFIASGGVAAAKGAGKAVLSGSSIGTVAKGGLAAGVGAIGTSVAAAALAGVAAYYGTTWILEQLAQKRLANTPEYRKFEAANAYRAARNQAARELGRELNAAEHKYLAEQFKASLKKIGG